MLNLLKTLQWSSSNASWQKVGDVVDAVGSGRRQLYNGQEYDYVFDVDVSEGMPPLKLPYNVSGQLRYLRKVLELRLCVENPYIAAQKFLERNELPLSYVDEVVQFIEKNTGGVQLGQGDAAGYVDPYTGASRYTGASAGAGSSTGGGDPFTGQPRLSDKLD